MLTCIEHNTFYWTYISKCFFCIQKLNFHQGLFFPPVKQLYLVSQQLLCCQYNLDTAQFSRLGSRTKSTCAQLTWGTVVPPLLGSSRCGHLRGHTASSRWVTGQTSLHRIKMAAHSDIHSACHAEFPSKLRFMPVTLAARKNSSSD